MFNLGEYRVSFSYSVNPNGCKNTICRITKEGNVIGVGTAHCNPKDNFNKNTGRKIAMARALAFAGFNKEIKTMFWLGYKERRGEKGLIS